MDQRIISPILGLPFHALFRSRRPTHAPAGRNAHQRNTGQRDPPDAGLLRSSRLGIVQEDPGGTKQSATGNRLPASVRRDRSCQGTCPIPLPATGAPPDLRGFLPGGYNELRRLSVPQNDCQTRVTTRPFLLRKAYVSVPLCAKLDTPAHMWVRAGTGQKVAN